MKYQLAEVVFASKHNAIILSSALKPVSISKTNKLTGELKTGDLVIYTLMREENVLLDKLVPVSKHQPIAHPSNKYNPISNLEFEQVIIQSRHCRWKANQININHNERNTK